MSYLLVKKWSCESNESFHRHDRRYTSRAEPKKSSEYPQSTEPSTGDETRFQINPHVDEKERTAQGHQVIASQAADHESQFLVPRLLALRQQQQGKYVGRSTKYVDSCHEDLSSA
ncbi:hypothetical protein NPIL_353841 [Nephila pilipes]|uniref:Uncharacterized protein n=1 Tax=Nephila pilipes TaxID=299642 RepID=A0A8X6P592_NEPPI|nr:hypothetical protein NPIL_353841 [Nephila pilipes]